MATKKWVSRAFSQHKGALHRELGVPEGQRIPAGKLQQALSSKSPHMRAQARLAKTARSFHHGRR